MATVDQSTATTFELSPIPILEKSPPMEPALETLDLPQQGQEVEVEEVLPAQPSRAVITRRMFYAKAGAAILGGPAALLAGGKAANAIADTRHSRPKEPCLIESSGNTLSMKKDMGTHHILFNNHSGATAKKPDALPANTKAVTWEMFSSRWVDNPVKEFYYFTGQTQYEDHWEMMHTNNIPAILLTPYLRGSLTSKARACIELAEAGLWTGGATVMAMREHAHRKENPETATANTRRHFLQTVAKGAGVGVAGAWAWSSTASTFARSGATKFGGGGNTFTQELSDASRAVHPELQHLFPDNYLFALILTQKVEHAMQHMGIKDFATIVGSNHDEFREVAQLSTVDRLVEILKYSEAIREAIDPRSLYQMIALHPSSTDGYSRTWQKGEIFEDSTMKQIVNQAIGAGQGVTNLNGQEELREAISILRRMRNS